MNTRFVEAVGHQVKSAVTIQWGVAMVNRATKSKRAALEDGVIAPILAEANVESAVIKLLRLKGSWERRGAAKALVAIVDILMGIPTFGLHEPAFAESPVIPQHNGISIDPGVIERSR